MLTRTRFESAVDGTVWPTWRTHVAVAAAVLLVVGLGVGYAVRQHLVAAAHELTVIADLKAGYLDHLAAERWASAGLSGSSFPQAELYERWVTQDDEHARDRLFVRLEQLAAAGSFSNVALLDPDLSLVWSSRTLEADVARWARERWPTGATPGSQSFLDVDWQGTNDPMLAVAVALPTEARTPAPLVVYVLMADDLASVEFLSRAIGVDAVRATVFRVASHGLVGAAGSSGRGTAPLETWSLPWSAESAVAVQVARGDVGARAVVEGSDDRGVAVLAAGGAVGDTGWFYLVQRDLSSVWGPVPLYVAVGLVVAALLHVTVIAGVARVRRRQLVAWQRAMQGDRFERDRALRLLQAIADVSTDAIFAKDLEGRYMLVNRAAAAFTGLVPDEMVGRDDSGIVSAAEFARVREHERLVAREGRVMSFEEAVTLPMGERVFQSSKGPLRDGDGRLFGVYGISRDVTEQLREERAIEAQARALASSVAELERFNRVLVDREITMIELKRRLNAALRELGRPQPFDLGSVDLDGRGDD